MEKHYVDYNFIKDEDIYFKELFLLDTFDKTCRICNVIFKRPQNKKTHVFGFIMENKSKLMETIIKELACYL